MYTSGSKDALKDVKNAAANVRDEAIDTAHEVRHDLRSAANQAGRNVRGFFATATDEITHASDSVAHQVRANPIQSSLLALGAGFIIGTLFRR